MRRGWFARGVPIFARTFALLLAALAVAFAMGMVLLALRRPPPAVQLSEVVALLSTRMPSANPLLRVYEVDVPPSPAPGYEAPAYLRTLLAQWLRQPETQVRVYIAHPPGMPRPSGMAGSAGVGAVDWVLGAFPAAMAQPVPARRDGGMPWGPQGPQARKFNARGRAEWPRGPANRMDGAPPVRMPAQAPLSIVEDKVAHLETTDSDVTSPVLANHPVQSPLDPASARLRQHLPPYVSLPLPDAATRVAEAQAVQPDASAAASSPMPAPVRSRSASASIDRPDANVRVGDPQRVRDAPPPAQTWRPDSMLIGAFIATARQADGRWRVVERVGPASRIGSQLALVTAAGLIALLPLAWWFSRALSAPILRFARAADHMGQDAAAPPLPLEGPAEIVRAAASFNAMQARINRLVRERTQMVGAIAHDLRTPLARLSFRLDELPADARDKAAADISEMSLMIQSALEFIRDQHCIGARERFDLRQLVESVADDLADVGEDVRFAAGAPAPLQGDPLALRRMVGNLVDNALKYGQQARLQLREAGDGYALLIDDIGPGVDPAGSEQLFMPFVRGEASRNRETGGIGLGLATARGIALAHGGDIRLENRTVGGLRVAVTLPRSEALGLR